MKHRAILGVLAGSLVGLQNRLLGFLVHLCFRRVDGAPGSILVFRSSAIGDFICALPALHRLRQRYPHSRITLLTTPTGNPRYWHRMPEAGGRALANARLIDEVIFFYASDLQRPKNLLALRRQVRAVRPEATFLLPFSGEPFLNRLKKILLLRCLGVRQNLRGFEMRSSLGLFRGAQFARRRFPHQVVAALEAVDETGAEQTPIVFPLSIPAAAVRRVDELWAGRGLNGNAPVVALSPGARFLHKRWPLENFAALCARLLAEFPVRVVVIGGQEDQELGAALASASPERIHNLAGSTTLLETAEVLRRCCLFIGNDSGAAHLAAAVGTPCVTLFSGIVFAGLWEPWGAQHVALRHRVPCEFCFSEGHCPTGTMECIRGIAVDDVLAAARRTLATGPALELVPAPGGEREARWEP